MAQLTQKKLLHSISEQLALLIRQVADLVAKKFKRNRNKKFSKIGLPTIEGLEFVRMKRIIRFEASGNYTNCHLVKGRKKLIIKRIGEFEIQLTTHNFFRVHDAHLINIIHIEKYLKPGHVIMSDGSAVKIARRKKEQLLSVLCFH